MSIDYSLDRTSRRLRFAEPKYSYPTIAFVLFLVTWQLVSDFELVNPLFISSPVDVFKVGVDTVVTQKFWHNVYVTSLEFVLGFVAAVVIAVPFGLVTGWYKRLHYATDPLLTALNSMPRLALLPLVVLWLGFDISAKVLIVFLGAFFPIAVNVFHAVSTPDRRLHQVATVYEASDLLRFRTVIFPSIVPFVTTGARVGVGRSVSGVVVAEFYGAQAGLAQQMFFDGNSLKTDSLFFHLAVITALAMVTFSVVARADRHFEHWRRTS